MQVNHSSDHVTHAVVGIQKAEELQISNSAEFFHILSSTLYSDKPLAVIREVLCNAWDAHIEAGRTDLPVEVEITNEVLKISDKGPGIPKDKIVPIYGTYGGSTKAHNDEVTGGFGLGCKAPFSYVDHFAVTSCYAGTKTIYRMALSAAQLGGKPSIIEILSIPCGDETGITVEIDIKNYRDAGIFRSLVHRIAGLGEMKVNLNGQPLPTVPFSKAKHRFVLLKKGVAGLDGHDNSIFARCGNVVYPLARAEEYDDLFGDALRFIKNISTQSYYSHNVEWNLVLLAPPGSISPTPSRESISLTPRSIAMITELLTEVVSVGSSSGANKENHVFGQQYELVSEMLHKTIRRGEHHNVLLSADSYIPTEPFKKIVQSRPVLFNSRDVAVASLACSPKFNDAAYRRQFIQRVQLAVKTRLMSKDAGRSIVRAARKFWYRQDNAHKWYKSEVKSNWFHRVFTYPMTEMLKQAGLPATQLLHINTLYEYTKSTDRFSRVIETPPVDPDKALPFFRKVIVLATNRTTIMERLERYPEWFRHFPRSARRNEMNSLRGALAYITPRKIEEIEKARKLFKDLGYTVIDLTVTPAWEKRRYYIKGETTTSDQPIVPAPKVVRKKGVPRLSAFTAGSAGVNFDVLFSSIENDQRTENPVGYLQVSRASGYTSSRGRLNMACLKLAHKHFGDQIGVVNSAAGADKMDKNGIPPVEAWCINQLAILMKSNPNFMKLYSTDLDNFPGRNYSYDIEEFYSICRSDEELRQHFKLPSPIPRSDSAWEMMDAFEFLRHRYIPRNHPEFASLVADVEKLKPSRKMLAFHERLRDSKITSILNNYGIRQMLLKSTDSALKDKIRATLISFI